MHWVLYVHLVAAWFMTGVIWYVQVVHYPSFAWVDRTRFPSFEASHRQLTSVVVMPVMLIEAISGVWLMWHRPTEFLIALELLMLGAIWTTTFLVSVPLHEKLSVRYDEEAAKRLVATNWPRCGLWTARAILVLFVLGGTA